MKVVVPRELLGQPQERLLKVVVYFSGYFKILQIFLAVEGDLLGLNLSILDLNFVSAQDNGDVFAHSGEIPAFGRATKAMRVTNTSTKLQMHEPVPVRDTFVSDTGGDIKHDDGALPLNAVDNKNVTISSVQQRHKSTH